MYLRKIAEIKKLMETQNKARQQKQVGYIDISLYKPLQIS